MEKGSANKNREKIKLNSVVLHWDWSFGIELVLLNISRKIDVNVGVCE